MRNVRRNDTQNETKDPNEDAETTESDGSEVRSTVGATRSGWRGALRDSSSSELARVHQPISSTLFTNERPDLEMAKLRFEKGKLYGREAEVQTLVSAALTSSSSERSVVLVHGTSGVGKSVLVAQLEEPVRQAGGIYALGKYDFQHASMPYLGITLACRAICQQLLERPREMLKEKMIKALGNSLDILSTLLPALPDLLDLEHRTVANEGGSGSATEAHNRITFALGTFLRVMTTYGPVVMVMDDLQWADAESFALLESFLRDSRLGGFCLVGCCRTDEVDSTHQLSQWIRDVEVCIKGVHLTRLSLCNMNVNTINDMLFDILQMDSDKTTDLAAVVHRKTHGNAFFVVQFLNLLHDMHILAFSVARMKWTWNIEQIEEQTMATDNVIDLMKKKMESLPKEMSEILSLASCLGSSFTEHALFIAVRSFQEQNGVHPSDKNVSVEQRLSACIEEGFIEKTETKKYTWVHDKIREAAFELIKHEDPKEIQFRIGEALNQNLTPQERSDNIFVIANLINDALDTRYATTSNVVQISRLNLQAGRIAMASASFSLASSYLSAGIRCLPSKHWEDEYSLSLDLYSSAAETELYNGHIENMKRHCQAVISQGCPVIDSIRVHNVLISHAGLNGSPDEACSMLVSLLQNHGCKFPRHGQILFISWGVLKLQMDQRKYRPESLITYTEMTDEVKIRAMGLLDKLITFSYFSSSSLLPLSILKSYQYTIQDGVCEYSPITFALAGLILATKLKDFTGARRYGEYAVSLLDANPRYDHVVSRTLLLVHNFCMHPTVAPELSLKPFLRGYNMGFSTGDVESSIWNIHSFMAFSVYLGKQLDALEVDYEIYMNQAKSYNQILQHTMMSFQRQVVHCLMGRAENCFKLKGDIFDIDSFESENQHQAAIIACKQHDLLAFMCDDIACAELSCKIMKNFTAGDLSPGTTDAIFLELNSAISCYGAARKTNRNRRKYLGVAKKARAFIKTLVKSESLSYKHVVHMVDAELAAFKGERTKAVQHYEAAILRAGRRGAVNYQGVANERLGDYMAECGDISAARYHWFQAIDLYRYWGALAKVDQVEKKVTP